MWHEMSPSQVFLIYHRMPKFHWLVFLHPRSSYGNVIETLIQAIPGAIKKKEPRCTTCFQCPTESYSRYWSKNMGFLSFPQGLEDFHIQKDTMSMPYVNTMEELEGISWRIVRPSKTRFNLWSTQIRSNSENLSMVIRSINIKDQLGAVFCLSFDHEFFFHSWMCFLRNVNTALMSACAWNEWTCTFFIMNLADVSKKG